MQLESESGRDWSELNSHIFLSFLNLDLQFCTEVHSASRNWQQLHPYLINDAEICTGPANFKFNTLSTAVTPLSLSICMVCERHESGSRRCFRWVNSCNFQLNMRSRHNNFFLVVWTSTLRNYDCRATTDDFCFQLSFSACARGINHNFTRWKWGSTMRLISSYSLASKLLGPSCLEYWQSDHSLWAPLLVCEIRDFF